MTGEQLTAPNLDPGPRLCPGCGSGAPAHWDGYRGTPVCAGCRAPRLDLLPLAAALQSGRVVSVPVGFEHQPAPVAGLQTRAGL